MEEKRLSKKEVISIVKQLGMMPTLYRTVRHLNKLMNETPALRSFINKPMTEVIMSWFRTENDVILRLDEMERAAKKEREKSH